MPTYKYTSDVKIEKILPDSKLKNKDLRLRKELTPLQKTAHHRYNYDSESIFAAWFLMLDMKEQEEVVKYCDFSTNYLLRVIFHHDNVTIDYEDKKKLKEGVSQHAFKFIFDKLKVDFKSPEAQAIMKVFTAKFKK